jgi:ADP-heptose:LPS heptosyltransferase
LRLPETARRFAERYRHDGPKIAVLPAGSSGQRLYPPMSWWTRLTRAIGQAFPSARVYLTGVSASVGGRTATTVYPRPALDRLFRACPTAVDAYDIGLWNQLALIEQCAMVIAPHTGFAFLAPCVGTPWLAIAGASWPEYFFNDVSFYSVLPSCPLYPCYGRMKAPCRQRLEGDRPVICMDPRQLNPRIRTVLDAVRLLLDPAFTYEEAVALRRRQVAAAGLDRDRFWSFDGAIRL